MSSVVEPIIDTHQHLWDLDRFRLPWIVPGAPLAHSFLLADYQAAAAGLGITRTIYMEVDVAPDQQAAEARFVAATCNTAGSGMVAGVVGARPGAADFPATVGKLALMPEIKGVRQVLHVPATPAGYSLGDQFVAGVELLGECGLSFDLCMRTDELSDAGSLCDRCPGTRFILDHCGNPRVHNPDGTMPDHSNWQRDIERLTRRPNLICKVSGLLNTATPGAWGPGDLAPIIDHVLDSFGPERVVFGSDWPVCTPVASLTEWVAALKAVISSRSSETRRRLLHDNAVRVYRLK